MAILIHNPKNETAITEIFAWVGREADGTEGIMAAILIRGADPVTFITAKRSVAELMRPKAVEIAKLAGRTAHLLKFTNREEVKLD